MINGRPRRPVEDDRQYPDRQRTWRRPDPAIGCRCHATRRARSKLSICHRRCRGSPKCCVLVAGDIEMQIIVAADLQPIEVDLGELEIALLNVR